MKTKKDKNIPSLCNIGYFGYGEFIGYKQGKTSESYSCWKRMIERCYDGKYNNHPTYIGTSVCLDWHNYQNFAQWHKDNYIEGWQLDKDILVEGNKIYSPDTCVFVPSEINQLFKKELIEGKYSRGVAKIKRRKSFKALIRMGKERMYLGSFSTQEEANKVYSLAYLNKLNILYSKWENLVDPRVLLRIKEKINGVTEDF